MSQFPIFLSCIICTKNNEDGLRKKLENISNILKTLVEDYELVIVDNVSIDGTVPLLKELTSPKGLPNLQVYTLTKEVDLDTAAWAGIENALGDFVVTFNPSIDDLTVLPKMIEKVLSGSEVVFAHNRITPKKSIGFSMAYSLFNLIYKFFSGIQLSKETPQYRILSKRVISFILQHNQPAITYPFLPGRTGFKKSHIEILFRRS